MLERLWRFLCNEGHCDVIWLDHLPQLEEPAWDGSIQQANVKTFYDRLVARASDQVWIPVLSVGGTE